MSASPDNAHPGILLYARITRIRSGECLSITPLPRIDIDVFCEQLSRLPSSGRPTVIDISIPPRVHHVNASGRGRNEPSPYNASLHEEVTNRFPPRYPRKSPRARKFPRPLVMIRVVHGNCASSSLSWNLPTFCEAFCSGKRSAWIDQVRYERVRNLARVSRILLRTRSRANCYD